MKADMNKKLWKTLLCSAVAVFTLIGCGEKKTSNYNVLEDEFDYLITVGFLREGRSLIGVRPTPNH